MWVLVIIMIVGPPGGGEIREVLVAFGLVAAAVRGASSCIIFVWGGICVWLSEHFRLLIDAATFGFFLAHKLIVHSVCAPLNFLSRFWLLKSQGEGRGALVLISCTPFLYNNCLSCRWRCVIFRLFWICHFRIRWATCSASSASNEFNKKY